MLDNDGKDRFGEMVDNLMTEVDLENRGCQLVSPAHSVSSETEQISVLNKLRSLLDAPSGSGASPKLAYDVPKSPQYDGVKDFGTHELTGALLQRVSSKGSSKHSSAASQTSEVSAKSQLLKNTDRTNLLKHAEAVIEYQRDRINALEAAVTKFNSALTQTTDMYKEELQRHVEDNLKLRQDMQKVVVEFEVLSKRYEVDMGESDSLKKQVNYLSHDLSKKEMEIREMQSKMTQLPIDNNDLKEKNRLLANEVDRLNREIQGLSLLDSKINAKATTAALTGATQACAAQHDRLKASSKCIAQLENDLQAYKRLTESQSMDIKRLNYQIEKMRGASKPNDYMVAAQRQMLQIRSVFLQLAKQAKEPKPVTRASSIEDDVNNRSLFAAYNMKTTAELRDMYERLLEAMNRNISRYSRQHDFYSLSVSYSCDDIHEELQVHIDESMLTFTKEAPDATVTEVIKIPLSSVVGVKKIDDANEFCIHTNDLSIHVVRAPNKDIFNRLHYALQYAGFITEHRRFSIFSKVDLGWLPADFSWPKNIAVVMTAESTLNEQCPEDYEGISQVVSDIYVITDPMERLMTLDPSTNSLVVLGPQLSSSPIILPCQNIYALRVCDPMHVECDILKHADAPTATLANGAPTTSFFAPSQHTFAFISDNRKVLFVNGVDAENEKRLISLVINGNYRQFADKVDTLQGGDQLLPEHTLSLLKSGAMDIRSNDVVGEVPPPLRQETASGKVFEFGDDKLILYMEQDEQLVVDNNTGFFRVNEGTNEVAISSGSSETYVLNFASPETLLEFVRDLEAHGFRHQKESELHRQVCIVTAGCLQLYKDATQQPIVTFNKKDTTVSVNESSREIKIENITDKTIKMTLDCTSPLEFRRWKFALGFAGFIKTSLKTKPRDALKKYIFPIKIFDENVSTERRAFQVEPKRICLYVNPTVKEPFLLMERSQISLELVDPERRLRMYVNRNTKMEERFDFVLAMLTDYQSLKAALKKHGYTTDPPRGKGSTYHFVLAKSGLIAIHRTKFDPEPKLVLERKNYSVEVSNKCIKFTSKVDLKHVINIQFKKDFNFKRWLMALKVAGYLPLTHENVPILYMPTIVYGHICPEIPHLLKGHLK
ncbi:2-oxoglutarate E2 dihydrolipoamide succinyltransferase, putative [Babesia ovis]|uniref:2-oxoglutarate E2 dihydrolipoamide succinyltransferase, putative n=1 Tax=Babesia ovis TaxID=5869 RepID=A0A9W5WTI3_BABOV|nr:2-oxoglutarate E2 dihydrolipoamide succinyltransferase, putative [Babesia ovis]